LTFSFPFSGIHFNSLLSLHPAGDMVHGIAIGSYARRPSLLFSGS
jgi:hypothetical protein